MENFDWTRFTKKIAVKSTLPEMYNAWTQSAELEKWFLKSVKFYSSNGQQIDHHQNVKANSKYEWIWYGYDDPLKGEIIQANGHDFIQFTFDGGCIVNVKLEAKDNYVLITLEQHDIPTDNQSKQYIRLGCTNGWTFYLTNLKSIYEGGIDLRNKDQGFGVMINN